MPDGALVDLVGGGDPAGPDQRGGSDRVRPQDGPTSLVHCQHHRM